MAKKILIIEDDVDMTRLMKSRLEFLGYSACVISDGEQAMESFLREKPDLVILDILLPKRDGYKICTEIKSNKKFRHVPIIMFTALGLDLHKEVGIDLGADAYISKTAGFEKVLEKIGELVKQ